MKKLIDSEQITLTPQPAQYSRAELFISGFDAARLGLNGPVHFAILSRESLFPGVPDEEHAVRIEVRNDMEPGGLRINQIFFQDIGLQFGQGQSWCVMRVPDTIVVKEAVLEPAVEQTNIEREIHALQRERHSLFVNRCLLLEAGSKINGLSLRIAGRGYFKIRSIEPSLDSPQAKTLLVFDEKTRFKLFVPNGKQRAVDMVIVVDASGSMDLEDYVDANNRPNSRMIGVRGALETLFQKRLVAGSRISRLATVVFAGNAGMLYPVDTVMTDLQNVKQIEEIRRCTRNLCNLGLERLRIDRTSTNISGALRFAAELLNYYSEEGSEKVLVLLSDGADWKADHDSTHDGEIINTLQDPAVLADNLHYDSKIRIHTVAISDEQAFKRYIDRKFWHMTSAIPNTALLREIAQVTRGIFFASPNARVLSKFFEEIGEGNTYPIN